MVKIAIFSTHTTWPTHFETELDIAQQHLDRGEEVDFYSCRDRNLQCCDNFSSVAIKINQLNSDTKARICDHCISLQNTGFNMLKGAFKQFPLINKEQLLIDYQLDQSYLTSSDKLKSLYHDEIYDIGWSLLSSFVSFSRNPFLKLLDYKTPIQMLYCDSIRVYETAKAALEKESYDRIYVFNGRFSYTKGLLRLGQNLGIPVHIHERGSVPQKYSISINKTPHDIGNFYQSVNTAWEEAKKSNRNKLGSKFYENKLKGFGGSWKSFTGNFEPRKLPDTFNTGHCNTVLYTSSEDEFVAVDSSWNNPYFASQLEGIRFLCQEFQRVNKPNQTLYIRIHPNSKEMSQDYLNQILALENNNIVIIPPESSVNSYELLFHADKVITFGSTITIEAVFWKKPTVLLGNSFFSAFKGPIIPESREQIASLCFESDIKAGTQTDAIKIGYYLRTFGHTYKYYKAKNYKEGYFKGINLFTGQIKTITYLYHKFKKKFHSLRKI